MAHLLITGASGYLGKTLVPLATAEFSVCHTYHRRPNPALPGGVRLDVRYAHAVAALVEEWAPEVIIHLAGSNRTTDMAAVIVGGADHVAQAARAVGARLLFLSSDVIFDGRAGPYDESSPPRPLHDYGRAKVAAEERVAHCPNHVIIRTSLIYDLDRMDHFTAWLVNSLDQGQPVTLFEDQLRNPVWARSLAEACLELAAGDYQGILNVAGDQVISRSEYGLKLLDWWAYKNRQGIGSGPTPAHHPRDCRLDLGRAGAILRTPLPGIDAVLEAARSGRSS